MIRETGNTGKIWLLAAGSWRYWRRLPLCVVRAIEL